MSRLHCHCLLILTAATAAACGSGGGVHSNSGGGPDLDPPTAGTVRDGNGNDVDTQTSTSTIGANWSGFVDAEGPIDHYEWAIGSSAGATDLQDWTVVDSPIAANSTLTLSNGVTYFVSVRAYDLAGNVSPVATSDGVQVMTAGGGGGGGGGNPVMASSLSQWGVTWDFDVQHQVGHFANGDWWVIGPVNIVQITPASTVVSGRTINGSMVNPVPNGTHGYDSTLYGQYAQAQYVYSAALNVATGVSVSQPLRVLAGSSLISSISQMTPDPVSFSQLSTAAVLTVLAAPPAADAFRPPYAGTDKTIRFRESQLDYARLGTLAPVAGTPTPASLAPQFARVWLDHCPSWISRFMHPVLNMPDYGRDFTAAMGSGVLVANMNFTNQQKRDMVLGLVQIGIDTCGNLLNGCNWGSVSSQCAGRKFPMLFAGTLLSAADMQNVGQTYPSGYFGPGSPNNASWFGEDSSTFYVQQTSAGVYNWGFGGYSASYLNLPEWGNYHATVIANDNAVWGADPYRRCCTANAWIGECLAARVMGLRTAWNHPAFFDYMDRYMQTEPAGWTQAWVPWHATAWNTYRPQL
ncbi:MAG TPA: fibronectin type III domain-containing protein [Planctomycetota bacterium]|nr:fibronectin type III domain-containing protein [Planctomycetota bacterium]